MDPHPLLPAAQGWQPAATAPQTATWVQLGYPPQGFRKDPPIVIAHWASDMSGEEQPGYEGWFRDNLGHGGRSSGFVEVPTGWVAWRPLWPQDRAAMEAAHDRRVTELLQANNTQVAIRRALSAEIADLRNAVAIAAAVFKSYAEMHAAKGTRDGEVKAAANAELARQMNEALAAQWPAVVPPEPGA